MLKLPQLPRIIYMPCTNLTRRSRYNSSSRCCYRARGHVDPTWSRKIRCRGDSHPQFYIVDSVVRIEYLDTTKLAQFLFFFLVHFRDALGKFHQSWSELISIGPFVRILGIYHGLFVKMDKTFTWYYKGKLRIRTSAQIERTFEQLW